jgi:hypothetical protein
MLALSSFAENGLIQDENIPRSTAFLFQNLLLALYEQIFQLIILHYQDLLIF